MLSAKNAMLFSSFFSFFLMSCADDDLETTDAFSASRGRDGGGPNDRGNDNQRTGRGGDSEVSDMDPEVLTDWMDLLLKIDRYAHGMRPTASARAIAYINLAAYETLQPGMGGYQSNDEYLPGLSLPDLDDEVSYEIALNTAYAEVMDHFMINIPSDYRAKIDVLSEAIRDEYGDDLSETLMESSTDWGATIASEIIAYSQTDTDAEEQILDPQPRSYVPPTGEGFWTWSAEPERALFPYWGSVRTFVVSTSEVTSVPPIAYSSVEGSAYYEQMLEVSVSNDEAREEDGEALWIAEFWSDDVESLTYGPPMRQLSIARQLIDHEDLDMQESAHLMLKIGFSLNDAAVSAWEQKYEHMVMRPNVFIHEFIDPDFQTNLYSHIPWPNPSFPGYPSGHSTFASAAAGVFIDFFGDRTDFTDRSHEGRTEFRGFPRSFDSFTEMAEENGYSRIPLGVHMRMDCTEGLRLGYEIARGVNRYDLRRPSA